ncbi:TetR/AcrR family transcriptional regulator [Humibacter ginsenosidimutans]|uniref:TetR/AcrR family transcriptional regulator n=1 Tax=Humibacter ginsenosidimutans TaxID=2599293 RepID=A0A5B8M4T6_9MICO|nr:TetR/AcrR family transcriptional regulator [Humibacter ginsenosidimutans]QDZ15353.1 TetR/AcrR family transcriptional regulator [Humibacter ginsenosidimutans]
MADATARQQRSDERRRGILDAARARAESDGWSAVTTRHLADAIGYTQPVLYGHFPGGKTEIMRTIALEGFVELAARCRTAVGRTTARRAVEAVAGAYVQFAAEHPAVYEAMFQQPIDARFASEDSATELRQGFAVLAEAVGEHGDGTKTEVFWGALHGIAQLELAGRMNADHRTHRIREIGALFGS